MAKRNDAPQPDPALQEVGLVDSLRLVRGLQRAYNAFVQWRRSGRDVSRGREFAKRAAWVIGFGLAAGAAYHNAELTAAIERFLNTIMAP